MTSCVKCLQSRGRHIEPYRSTDSISGAKYVGKREEKKRLGAILNSAKGASLLPSKTRHALLHFWYFGYFHCLKDVGIFPWKLILQTGLNKLEKHVCCGLRALSETLRPFHINLSKKFKKAKWIKTLILSLFHHPCQTADDWLSRHAAKQLRPRGVWQKTTFSSPPSARLVTNWAWYPPR